MTSYVVATAGHVDHGKSTLVRALTGMDPDRWAEERRRGLSIDLGFAWTTLPDGDTVSFVDVPGHEKFLANTLAGLGAAPVVTFVVAADEGWSAQSSDHRDAVAALGIERGVIVITKTDRAPDRVEAVVGRTREELAGTGLHDAPVVALSAVQGTGVDTYLSTLTGVLRGADVAPTDTRIRLWVDRAFNVAGAGAVVTGTLTAGSLQQGDQLELLTPGHAPRTVSIRGLQSRGDDRTATAAVDRVAVNLRGANSASIARGDVLVTPGAWHLSTTVDVRRAVGRPFTHVAGELRLHLGTASLQARVRVFDADHARLTLEHPLPVAVGDRLVLRDTGSHVVRGGVTVLDPDPPAFQRRGDGRRQGEHLRQVPAHGDAMHVVDRHGAVRTDELARLGYRWDRPASREGAGRAREIGGWLVSHRAYQDWVQHLTDMVAEARRRDPMAGGLPVAAARRGLGSTGSTFLDQLVVDARLERRDGLLRPAGATDDMGPHEAAVRTLEARLEQSPFTAPVADELAALGLGPPQLAAAERQGRLLRLGGGVVVLPTAPARAAHELAQLPQPFTTSSARQALDTSRRVVIALLEHLDGRGWTRRLDDSHREVCQ